MTYAKVFKHGTCKESQHGYRLAQGIRFFRRDSKNFIIPLRGLKAAGVSLREGGRVCRQTNSNTRQEDCLHGQTLRKSHAGNTPICPIQGSNIERSGHRGSRSLTLQRSEEWLSQGKRKEQLSWYIALTGYHYARSARHTDFLSLTKVGVPALVKIMKRVNLEGNVKAAAIYARVSSDRQKEEQTIASQTASLIEHSQQENYTVPAEWIFQDEGYSGATLVRPGLEKVRDLAAEGQIECVLIYSPDRLSRKYAYQVLLVEEFARHGVEIIFIKSPRASTPEEQLLLQFQGMIAEYERAQIAERTRRGKRYKAKAGSVNVLSGAPYGFRYIKKTETSSSYYEIIEQEAEVVRKVFELYTGSWFSIGGVVRWLNDQEIPTRKRISRWERSTVWAHINSRW